VQDDEEVLEERVRSGRGLAGHPIHREGALCDPVDMPRPARRPASPDERQATLPLAKAPARSKGPTPEEVAKKVPDRDPSPPGQPDLAQLTLRLALPRAAVERLRARAIREGPEISRGSSRRSSPVSRC